MKKYYDKMLALDLKLKNEMENQRLKRQGLGVDDANDSDDDLPLNLLD